MQNGNSLNSPKSEKEDGKDMFGLGVTQDDMERAGELISPISKLGNLLVSLIFGLGMLLIVLMTGLDLFYLIAPEKIKTLLNPNYSNAGQHMGMGGMRPPMMGGMGGMRPPMGGMGGMRPPMGGMNNQNNGKTFVSDKAIEAVNNSKIPDVSGKTKSAFRIYIPRLIIETILFVAIFLFSMSGVLFDGGFMLGEFLADIFKESMRSLPATTIIIRGI